MFATFFKKETLKDTKLSNFFRKASSGEKKKVFMEVLRKATEDQKKILDKKI